MIKLLTDEVGYLLKEQYYNSQYQKHMQTNWKTEQKTSM